MRSRGARVLSVEAVALLALGGFLAVRSLGDDIAQPWLLRGLALFPLAAGALYLWCARALGRGRSWPRTPSYLLQFFCFVVSTGLAQAHRWGYAAALLGFALAGAVALASDRDPAA